MDELNFFKTKYHQLRFPHNPMCWMRRMFCDVINGSPPSLVDLPTAAGKTDVVVIWLIALAWYAKNRDAANPVPRRLVWVVNRRVLVQQVDDMAQELAGKLQSESGDCAEFAKLLRGLCKNGSGPVFNVIQLRGQRLDDRKWTLDPTVPQLIVGTVDQIGSRILFRGYGLGKWSRPLHAGILGVDAWICVDEAHLVPAFVITLRQVREIASRPVAPDVPEFIKSVFDKLPFWVSELSATPGLPKSKFGKPFFLEKDKGDEDDNVIKDRLRAKAARRVLWEPLPAGKKLADALAEKALGSSAARSGGVIAVFCSKANDAETVAKTIEKMHKRRVLLVTGRIRGYERDRLSESELFKRFRGKADTSCNLPAFLVGTAAAEVGLDADAESIVCDFASLPTLVQRLGRLDRIGRISKQLNDGDAPDKRPTMTIIDGEKGKTSIEDLDELAKSLSDGKSDQKHEFRSDFFSGSPWTRITETEADENEGSDQPAAKKKGKTKSGVEDAVLSATRQVLSPESSEEMTLSADWLSHEFASITSGPVVVPPLTDAVLRRWAATTPPQPRFLPVHPWLYGLLPNDEGTPLVGIAFRLEMDVLKHCSASHENEVDGDDGNDVKTRNAVLSCLSVFPPLRSELHLVPIYIVREWLKEHPKFTLAHFDGEEWTTSISLNELSAASVLVFPTSIALDEIKIGKKDELILKSGEQDETQRCWDVFNALVKDGAKYHREITVTRGASFLKAGDGVWRVPDTRPNNEAESGDMTTVFPEIDSANWKRSGSLLSFSKDGIAFELRYFRPFRNSGNSVELLDDHLKSTANHAKQFAVAIAPDSQEFEKLLSSSGQHHDPGKDHDKWQRVMGNTPSWRANNGYDETVRIAKPVVENPGNASGYRHEWGSLWKIKDYPEKTGAGMFRDLLLHLIVAHHGGFRPSMPDKGFDRPPTATKQNPARLEAIERFAALQSKLGYWRLAYLEGLLKTADVAASRDMQTPEVEQ